MTSKSANEQQVRMRRQRRRQFFLDLHHVMCIFWALGVPLAGALLIDKSSPLSWIVLFLAGPFLLAVQLVVFHRYFPRAFPEEEFDDHDPGSMEEGVTPPRFQKGAG